MNVVITGSTRGIGRGLAEQLLTRGHDVVVSGRSEDTVAAAVAELETVGSGQVSGAACDVRDPKSLQGLWDLAVERFGRVDAWVNNAGVSTARRPLWELDADEVDAVVDTNLKGTLHGMRIALAGMHAQGGGIVYNVEGFGSSGQKADGMAAYGATKRAVRYLNQAIGKDLADDAVRVGVISPGIVVTDLLTADYDGQPDKFEQAKKIFNILGDDVETVTSFVADGIVAGKDSIHWLTRGKAARRFMTAPFTKRDLFA